MTATAPLMLAAVTETVSAWLLQAVVYGSLVAALTWLLIKSVFRNARPAVHAMLWLVVLVKFIVPWGPGASYSLASLLGDWTGVRPPVPQAAPPVTMPAESCGVAYVFVESMPGAAAAPTQCTAAAPAPT